MTRTSGVTALLLAGRGPLCMDNVFSQRLKPCAPKSLYIHSGRPKTWKCFFLRKPLQIFKNVTENINNLGLVPIGFKSSIPIIHKVTDHGLATAMKMITVQTIPRILRCVLGDSWYLEANLYKHPSFLLLCPPYQSWPASSDDPLRVSSTRYFPIENGGQKATAKHHGLLG